MYVVNYSCDCDVAQTVSRLLPPGCGPGFEPGSGHVGFVVDKAALGQIFSEYFGWSCQAFPWLPHIHHPGLVQ
jgi:hypothetical protein